MTMGDPTKWGMRHHVTKPCDDENGRTWDIYRHGKVVTSGLVSRAAARYEAGRLDRVEKRDAVPAISYQDVEVTDLEWKHTRKGRVLFGTAKVMLGLRPAKTNLSFKEE